MAIKNKSYKSQNNRLFNAFKKIISVNKMKFKDALQFYKIVINPNNSQQVITKKPHMT